MRAFLGAASVEVQVRFAGDLLQVSELNVTQVDKCYQVGLTTTAELPLPLSPFRLLRVADDRLELCVPDSMQAQLTDGTYVGAHETVVVKWQAVEIAIVPSLPSRAHSWRRQRSWPIELFSGSAATVIPLVALFPAALLLLVASGDRSSIDHQTRPAHITYDWRAATAAKELAHEASVREAAKAAKADPATRPPQPVQANVQPAQANAAAAQANAAAKSGAQAAAALRDNGAADAPSHDDDSGVAGSAAADRARADSKPADVTAREAAARAGILGVLGARVQIAASVSVLDPVYTNDFVLGAVAAGDERGGGAPMGGNKGGSPAGGGESGAKSGGGESGAKSGGGQSGATSSGATSGGTGTLEGTATGDAYGEGGLGLVGSGAGGGGGDEGTIGLGDLGTIGHGGGSGTGSGYGRGMGGLGGHRAYAPDVVPGVVIVRGGLDKEMIRRIIRRHLNEVRFCYESALQNAPKLTGRVLVEFEILPDGSVASASAQQSTLADPAVGACTASAFSRWQFPSARGGGLTLVFYPFDFLPVGS